jgi:hypothetical protein
MLTLKTSDRHLCGRMRAAQAGDAGCTSNSPIQAGSRCNAPSSRRGFGSTSTSAPNTSCWLSSKRNRVLRRVPGACGSRVEAPTKRGYPGLRGAGGRWSAGPFARPYADSRRGKQCRRFQGSGRELWAIGSQACAPLFPLRDEQFRSSLGCRVCPLQGLQNIVPQISRDATAAVAVLSPLTANAALNFDIRLSAVDESLCESDEFRIGRAAATAQLVQEYV